MFKFSCKQYLWNYCTYLEGTVRLFRVKETDTKVLYQHAQQENLSHSQINVKEVHYFPASHEIPFVYIFSVEWILILIWKHGKGYKSLWKLLKLYFVSVGFFWHFLIRIKLLLPTEKKNLFTHINYLFTTYTVLNSYN